MLMYDFIDGALAEDEAALVGRHLAECAACSQMLVELQSALVDLPQQKDPAAGLPSSFWPELMNDVVARLPAHPRRAITPGWITDWLEFISVSRHLWVVGSAVMLLLLAAMTGTWVILRHEEPQPQVAAVSRPATTPGVPAVNTRLKQYLRKSKALLVGINNMSLQKGAPVDFSLERSTSRSLLHEARYLQDQPLDRRSADLLKDLQKIQTALANSSEREGLPEIRLIRGGIQEENLLFKIRIAETVYERIDDDSTHSPR
jgi:hypothetical protein